MVIRSPMQVDEEFRKKINKLGHEIRKKTGRRNDGSAREITNKLIHTSEWEVIEKKILGDINQIEFKINFDRRKKQ